jgi:hypothetical protein
VLARQILNNSGMSRADFAVRPARDRRRVGLASAGLAAPVVFLMRSSTGLIVGLVLALAAAACLVPRSWTRGDAFVMRGIVRTRRLPKANIQQFLVRDGLLGRQYVELVTRQGERLRVPATDRPVPRRVVEHEGARTPAEAVCNRLHLWHMVSAY